MARIHLTYRDISEDFQSAIKTMVADKPWNLDREGRTEAVTTFFDTVCTDAGVTPPAVEFYRTSRFSRLAPGYSYTPEITGSLGLAVTPASVRFPRWRTVEIVGAIRKHIDFLNGDRDSDPNAWAASAVYLATPVAFRDAARKGKVRGVTAKDTYTTASWQKLSEAGLTIHNDLRVHANIAAYFLANGELPAADVTDWTHGFGQQPTAAETAAAGGLLSEGDEELALIERAEQEALVGHDVPSDLTGQVAAAVQQAVQYHTADLVSTFSQDITDGLDALGIVALRKVSRGVVSGGYSMVKPVLINAIRQHLSHEEIAAKIASL